jgi:tRNA-splicing ligase RtcB (3'-phosphate/5'-hydroxy nucleic acid ligase)
MPLEFRGKYAECKVFADEVENEMVRQIIGFLDCPVFEGSTIRVMPDCHAGKGAVIGFTATLSGKVIPNVIGVDIGCGVSCWELGDKEIDYAALDAYIRGNIPSGFDVNDRPVYRDFTSGAFMKEVEEACNATGQKEGRVKLSLGSLGGGNHFIEVGGSASGMKMLEVHSGSRNFGLRIAEHYQEAAGRKNPFGELSWLEGPDRDDYFRDMKVAQKYASVNRKIIGSRLLSFLGLPRPEPSIESVHNYINFEDGMIRKDRKSVV